MQGASLSNKSIRQSLRRRGCTKSSNLYCVKGRRLSQRRKGARLVVSLPFLCVFASLRLCGNSEKHAENKQIAFSRNGSVRVSAFVSQARVLSLVLWLSHRQTSAHRLQHHRCRR